METELELFSITKHSNPSDLKEWVDYHLAIGFDKINICDNQSLFSIKNLLSSYKNVVVAEITGNFGHRGYKNQTILAEEVFSHKKGKTQWLIWLDDDEFLYSKHNENIKNHLNKNFRSISYFWKFISLPNVIEDRNETLIDTFNYTSLLSPFDNQSFVKTMVNLDKFDHIYFPTAHVPIFEGRKRESLLSDGERIDLESWPIKGASFYDRQPIIIYHYYHQSWKDWLYKCYKGTTNTNDPYRSVDRKKFEGEIVGKYIYEDNSMKIRKQELGI